MNTISKLIALALLGMLAGCSTLSVNQDYDPSADFTRLHTYAWATQRQSPTGDPRLDSDLTVQRIRGAIDAELAARGFKPGEVETADFAVAYYAAIGRKVDVYPTTTTLGYGWGPYYGSHYGMAVSSTEVHEYNEGTLIIDFVDGQSKNLVWRGTGQKALDESGVPPSEREARIRSVVHEILAQYPPPVKKQ